MLYRLLYFALNFLLFVSSVDMCTAESNPVSKVGLVNENPNQEALNNKPILNNNSAFLDGSVDNVALVDGNSPSKNSDENISTNLQVENDVDKKGVVLLSDFDAKPNLNVDLVKKKVEVDSVENSLDKVPVARVKKTSVAKKVYDFLSSGLNGRPKFAIGIGGGFGLIDGYVYYDKFTKSFKDIHVNKFGGFINFHTNFNLVDHKYFFLSFGVSYYHFLSKPYIEGSYDGQYYHSSSDVNLHSIVHFSINIGGNITIPKINKVLTAYVSLGFSGIYILQNRSLEQKFEKPHLYRADSSSQNSYDIYPSIGFGLELRLLRNLAIKTEFFNVFIDSKIPVFENHLVYFSSLYFGIFAFGLSVYI